MLKTLSVEPMHGWGIAERMEAASEGKLAVSQGSLCPALQRLKRQGWVRSERRRTENNRRARYYRLTAAGEREHARQRGDWERSSLAVNRVLRWAGGVA